MDHDSNYHGSLIAFEGRPDVVSTQLRLLPSSPHILILPHIQHFVEQAEDDSDEDDEEQTEGDFDAAALIQRVHDAATARTKAALEFLNSANTSTKRLVFLNGGSAGCRALCVSSIRQHQTDGNLAQARDVYDEAVSEGLAGLRARSRGLPIQQNAQPLTISTDPSAEAMRAAEALDIETASLQPAHIFDVGGHSPRPRSMSLPGPNLPVYDMPDPCGDGSPFFLFGAGSETGSEGALLSPASTQQEMGRGRLRAKPPSASMSFRSWARMSQQSQARTRSPSFTSTAYRSDSQGRNKDSFLLSPTSESFCSPPGTPGTMDRVVYGEAKLVRVGSLRSSSRRNGGSKRSRSLDRLSTRSTTTAASHPMISCSSESERRDQTPEPVATRKFLDSEVRQNGPATSIPQQSGTAKRPAIGPPALQLHSDVDSTRSKRTFVDRGTDALDDWEELVAELEHERHSMIDGMALPLIEDLVIHFKDETRNEELEALIQDLRNETDSTARPQDTMKPEDDDGPLIFPATPTSPEFTILVAPQLVETQPAPVVKIDDDEYDPYAAHSYNHGNLPLISHPVRASVPFVEITDPPTPAQTPPPSKSTAMPLGATNERFHDFDISGKQTAVCTQNLLRSLLNAHFPPEDDTDQGFHFPLLPATQDLWQPVFGVAEPESPRANERKVDLILAVGAQKGVKDDLAAAMVRQIEKLGVNSEGVSRSGRLDLRYLVANAMQTFTAQPLANQTKDNPFANPLLLATLIIPHLETYLAAHASIRFLLLEYPPEHLATVLALQRLAGTDTIKIAGLVDPSTPLPSLGASRRPRHSRNKSSLQGLESFTIEGLSFARANFLLSAAATDAEIEAFLVAILTVLMDISAFYAPSTSISTEKSSRDRHSSSSRRNATPRTSLSPTTTSRPSRATKIDAAADMLNNTSTSTSTSTSTRHYAPLPPAPRTSSISATSRPVTRQQNNNPSSTLPQLPPLPTTRRPASPSPSLRSSKAASVRTTRTGRSQYTMKSTRLRRHRAGDEKDGDLGSLADWDFGEEEEGEFDLVEERRLMPLYMRRRATRKANRHKALRWLGLA